MIADFYLRMYVISIPEYVILFICLFLPLEEDCDHFPFVWEH